MMPLSSSTVETKAEEQEENKDSKKSGAAVGFGSQGSKRKEAETALTQTKIKTQVNDTRVRISMSRAAEKSRLYSKYDIQKYDLKGS